MQLDNHLKGIIIGMTLTGLTGCELPPNISEYTEHKHTPSRPGLMMMLKTKKSDRDSLPIWPWKMHLVV